MKEGQTDENKLRAALTNVRTAPNGKPHTRSLARWTDRRGGGRALCGMAKLDIPWGKAEQMQTVECDA